MTTVGTTLYSFPDYDYLQYAEVHLRESKSPEYQEYVDDLKKSKSPEYEKHQACLRESKSPTDEKIEKAYKSLKTQLDQLPYPIKKITAITKALAGGAMAGYFGYWIFRLFAAVAKKVMTNRMSTPLLPLPFVLVGVISAATTETARLVHEIALKFLGNRNDFKNGINPDAKTMEKLRYRSWKIIEKGEQFLGKVDHEYSKFFKIRTQNEEKAEEMNIINYNPPFMEVFRKATNEHLKDFIQNHLSQNLGICIVSGLGFPLVGAQVILQTSLLLLILGVLTRTETIYRDLEEQKEMENKMYCDILAAMYPSEFDELEERERLKLESDEKERYENELKAINEETSKIKKFLNNFFPPQLKTFKKMVPIKIDLSKHKDSMGSSIPPNFIVKDSTICQDCPNCQNVSSHDPVEIKMPQDLIIVECKEDETRLISPFQLVTNEY